MDEEQSIAQLLMELLTRRPAGPKMPVPEQPVIPRGSGVDARLPPRGAQQLPASYRPSFVRG